VPAIHHILVPVIVGLCRQAAPERDVLPLGRVFIMPAVSGGS